MSYLMPLFVSMAYRIDIAVFAPTADRMEKFGKLAHFWKEFSSRCHLKKVTPTFFFIITLNGFIQRTRWRLIKNEKNYTGTSSNKNLFNEIAFDP